MLSLDVKAGRCVVLGHDDGALDALLDINPAMKTSAVDGTFVSAPIEFRQHEAQQRAEDNR